MKRKLRIGERYALSKHKRKQTIIRYFSLLAVLTSMCLYAVKQVSAQVAEPAATAVADIKPLQIGDTIPEWLWHHPMQVVNHPAHKSTITLSEYQNRKLVILDFWSTWCSSCIVSINKLQSAVGDFPGSFALLPITKQGKDVVIPFAKKRNWSFALPVADTLLHNMFPHRGIPHLVWLKNNRVIAVTNSTYGTAANIKRLLDGEVPEAVLYMNRPVEAVDVSKGLADQAGHNHSEHMEIFGYLPQFEKTSRVMAKEKRVYMVNLSPKELIAKAYTGIIPPGDSDKLIFSELPDSIDARLHPNPEMTAYQRDQWKEKHSISYHLCLPNATSRADLFDRMRDDLNRYFETNGGFYASIGSKEITTWVLSGTPQAHAIAKGGPDSTSITNSHYVIRNQSLNQFLYHLKTANASSIPFKNNSTYDGNVNITLNTPLNDLPAVQRELKSYGLVLTRKSIKTPVIIIKPTTKK